jgi:hypothetical protein
MCVAFTANYSFSGRWRPRWQQVALSDWLRESQYQVGSVFQRCSYGYDVRVCIHRGECSYVYEYLCLYCVSQKKSDRNLAQCTTPHGIYDLRKQTHTFGTNNWYTLLEGDLPFMEWSSSASWSGAPIVLVAVSSSHATPYKRGHAGAQESTFIVPTQCPQNPRRRTDPVNAEARGILIKTPPPPHSYTDRLHYSVHRRHNEFIIIRTR